MWNRPEVMLWIADLLYALAAILLLYAVLFVVVHLPVFPVRQIKVTGQLQHVTPQQVRYIVQRELNGNFFTVDLARTRQAFEQLPWVRKVDIRRKWPDRLEVSLEEHVPLARWGTLGMVNTYGEIFDASGGGQALPVFAGPPEGAAEMAANFGRYKTMLAPTGLRISQVVLTPRHAWELRCDNGLVIALGREQVDARLARFVAVYARTLAGLGTPVNYVDLRYGNGFAVRMQGFGKAGAARPAASGKAA
jgi:cell division protein FtsQ